MRTLFILILLCFARVVYAVPCSVPNAIPNDGLDDRAAIQTALDAQGCAELEIGVYEIAMAIPRPAGAAGWGQLQLTTGDILRGKGPGTRLHFTGGTSSNDFYGIWIRKASNVLVTDLFLDTSALTHNNEQSHAMTITGPADQVSVNRVWIDHPNRLRVDGTSYLGGDCIKIVGSDLAPVSTKITDSWFIRCDRSGVASTGGSRSIVIDGNTFRDTGGQDIDFEASSQTSSFTITNNHTFSGIQPKGAYSVALGTAHDIVFSNNILNGRGLHLYNVENVMVSDSVIIRSGEERPEPVVEIIKAAHRVTISNLQATRNLNTPGAVIRFGHHATAYPKTIRIMNSSLRSFSDAPLIAGAATDIQIFNTRFERTQDGPWACGAAACESWAVELVGGIVKTDLISLANNVFVGKWDYAVRVSGIRLGIGAVSLFGNQAPGVPHGLYCPSTLGISGPLVSGNNTWGVPLCGMTITTGN